MSRGDLTEADWRVLKDLLPIEPASLYKQRNRIERMFGHLKINRAIAARYDRLASSFLGMLHLATARYRLKFLVVSQCLV